MQSSSPNNIIVEVKRIVDSSRRSEIRLNANGGNSILVICEPKLEMKFIDSILEQLSDDKFKVIDLNHILCDFVENSKDSISDSFELLKGSPYQVFKTPQGEDTPDLFTKIIETISNSIKENKIPVIINTGSLYGSGIDNINIIENEVIMKSPLPLIILYPATHEGDKLLFLGKRPASKYRCMIVE